MEKKLLTGLSLSRCIKDIIDGVVKEEQVQVIIARTMARNSDEWHSIVCQYQNSCWQKDPITAAEICFRLLNNGKITQPRLEGKAYETIKNGHWR
jgi:hypothetical protein